MAVIDNDEGGGSDIAESLRQVVASLTTGETMQLQVAVDDLDSACASHGAWSVRPDELERRLHERLDALGLPPRAELLHVLTLPDFERAAGIGEFWGHQRVASSPSC